MTGVGGESELMCTSMTAHQLRAHAAQILRLSGGCDDIQPITNAAVITLQKNSPAADSPGSGDQYSNVGDHPSHDSLQLAATPANSGGNNKRRRRPAGTPDPDAEVVALSPKTLMESDRFICEICNQGFQRDQNLQMHRRHHKVPWKLVKNTSSSRLATHKKRVYVCPELTCLHHEPQHALGDLVGIKKHFRRKHCSKEQWVCDRCSKGYAVQSDYKAHLKTCGTRGHCCDCGRVFSRVESFIEHQDSCSAAPKVQKGTNMRSGSGKKLSITLQQRRSTLMTTRARNGVSSTDMTSPSRESNDTSIVPFANSASIESDKTAAARGSADSSTFMKEQVMTRTTNSSCRFDQSSNHNITRSSNVIPTWVLERRSELQQLLPLPGIDQVQSRLQESYNNADVTLASSTVEQAGHDMQLQALASHNFSARCSTKNSAICPEVISNFTRDCRSLVRPASSDSCCVVVDVPSLQLTIGHFSESPRDHQMISTSDRRSKFVIIDAAGSRDTKPNPKADVDQTRSLHGVAMSDYQLQTVQEANPDTEAAASGDHHAALIMQRSASNKGIGEDLALMSTFPAITASPPPRQTAQDSGPAAGVPDHNSGPDVIDKHIAKCADHQQQQVISQSELPIVARTSRIEGALTRQKELAATTCAEANKAREQARTEMKSALSDLAAARRTKEQARLESAEAENEIARAELIKHQAREQLQQASAEKAFAQHARDVAKRQKDIAETELADAKRMRERAQAEIDKSRLVQLKARSSRDDQCSPGAVNAITRLMSSPRDHHNFQNSTEICQVCKSESAVGSDLTLGLHQTNRGDTPIRPSSAVNASRPVPPDHKIRVTQTASHEISSTSAAGLVSYPKRGESIKVRLEDATCSDKSQLVLEQSHGIN